MNKNTMLPVVVAALLCITLTVLSGCAAKGAPVGSGGSLPAHDPVALRMLLAEMPKGAELHTHLSGVPYAEDYIGWAARDGACIDRETGRISAPPCDDSQAKAAGAYTDADLWNHTVNALSTRQDRRDDRMWGHDQFFVTFGRFGTAGDDKGRMLALTSRQAARDKVQYLEVMLSAYGPQWVTPYADTAGWNGDPKQTLERLRDAGLFEDMPQARQTLSDWESKRRNLLGDGPGSDVKVRYINQIVRVVEPAAIFAQMAWSFELAKREPLVLGLNMVAPEDAPISVRDYDLHMRMLDFFHKKYPEVRIALHAGELTGGLTTPEALSDHIRKAVTLGHADRIGHGVDIAYEGHARDTLAFMRENRIALVSLLTSNEVILRVSGPEHPIRTYMAAGVPVALSTDDMGVGRTDLTTEYVKAVRDQHFTYEELKHAARNSLEYSFLPGASLWADPDGFRMNAACAGDETPDGPCSRLLNESEKAAEQWRLEKRLRAFEAAR